MASLATLLVVANCSAASAHSLSRAQAESTAKLDAATTCHEIGPCVGSKGGPCKHSASNAFLCRLEYRMVEKEPYGCDGGVCEYYEDVYRCFGTEKVSLRRGFIESVYEKASTVCTELPGGTKPAGGDTGSGWLTP